MAADSVVIDLPTPALVVLIGLQGSGKSTVAHRHFAPVEILSSDEFRARMCNDPASQSNTAAAREQLIATLHRRMANKVTTVVDSTNIHRGHRAELCHVARRHAVPAVAIVLDVSVEQCRERIAERARIIRDEVLDEYAARWPSVMHEVANEGYLAVHVLSEQQVPAMRFRHALPLDDDPDRWVTIEHLAPSSRSFRCPADEIRRHPRVLEARTPRTFDYVRAAAEHATSASAALQPRVGHVLRVRLPHHHPIDLIYESDGWRILRTPRQANDGPTDSQQQQPLCSNCVRPCDP